MYAFPSGKEQNFLGEYVFSKTKFPKSLSTYRSTHNKNTGRTISNVLRNMFASGTTPKMQKGKKVASGHTVTAMAVCPHNPADVFAACAHLLNVSSAFGHYSAATTSPKKRDRIELWLSQAGVDEAVAVGKRWHKAYYGSFETPPKEISKRWSELVSYWDWPVNNRIYHSSSTFPNWWQVAYFLMIAADEAADGVGFAKNGDLGHEDDHASELRIEQGQNLLVKSSASTESKDNGGNQEHRLNSLPPTICIAVDPDVVCVQPKSLVSEVGSSARVFSHNLALLGPRGVVRTQWARLSSHSEKDAAKMGLRLLLIPTPDQLKGSNFVPRSSGGKKRGLDTWRTFEIDQDWLKIGNYAEFTQKLVLGVKALGHEVHGVIFPELALDRDIFRQVSERLDRIDGIEFFIAGTSQHCEGRTGNFVWCERFDEIDTPTGKTQYLSGLGFVQSKHHRWKLDKKQIQRYNLPKLGENYDWWEHINVGGRELNFVSFRANSVFSALVCEDLARSEPCHDILRAIGPNLLFALLMDGPQISSRWPARYASYLSEDPGTAVLTLTSRGLTNMVDPDCDQCVIAYFSDGEGNEASRDEIAIPKEAYASILHMISKPTTVSSIDGRVKSLERWTLASNTPLSHVFLDDDDKIVVREDLEFTKERKRKLKS